jgi:hypothetical protein
MSVHPDVQRIGRVDLLERFVVVDRRHFVERRVRLLQHGVQNRRASSACAGAVAIALIKTAAASAQMR